MPMFLIYYWDAVIIIILKFFLTGCAEQGQLARVAERFSGRGGRKGLSHLLTLQPINFKGSAKNKGPK